MKKHIAMTFKTRYASLEKQKCKKMCKIVPSSVMLAKKMHYLFGVRFGSKSLCW